MTAVGAHRRRVPTMVVPLAAALFSAAIAAVVSGRMPPAAAQQPCGGPVEQLTDSGFEDPDLGTQATFREALAEDVPGWSTTAADQRIELWANGFRGVESDGGDQHAELNVNEPSTLFQVLDTSPGTRLVWRLSHRGRNGTDVMRVLIGPATGPVVAQQEVSDGEAWGSHRGEYEVPAGQTATVFGFSAVSAAGGDLTQGNFLDEIYFGSAPCLAVETHATDAAGQVVDGGSVGVGDEITFRSTVRNAGGLPADRGTLVDEIPAGMRYVPGSLSIEGGPLAGPRTDALDGDGASSSADGAAVLFDVGDRTLSLSGVRIAPKETTTFVFRVRMDPVAAGGTVTDRSVVSYEDPYADEVRRVESNTVTLTVAVAPVPVTPVPPVPTSAPVPPDPGPAPATASTVGPPVPADPTNGAATTSPSLPPTGGDGGTLLLGGVLLMAIGFGALGLRRLWRSPDGRLPEHGQR